MGHSLRKLVLLYGNNKEADQPVHPGSLISKIVIIYSITCVKQPLSSRQKIGFQDQLWLNAGQKYCRMLQGEHSAILLPLEHSAILLTFIELPFVIKVFVLSIFEWPFYTGFTVILKELQLYMLYPQAAR